MNLSARSWIGLQASTLQHLRFPFSFLLAPVFLWALLEMSPFGLANKQGLFWSFVILHGLVYPASNGFNSYWDRDEGPIGGVEKPMQVTRELLVTATLLDGLALVLSFGLVPGWRFGALMTAYIAASRAYSHPVIRWKARPWVGWFVVAFFQGAVIFAAVCEAGGGGSLLFRQSLWIPALLSSLLLGASYPLTQVYQHDEDARRGDRTLSRYLGVRGTFVFSGTLNLLSLGALAAWWLARGHVDWLVLTTLGLLPGSTFLVGWTRKVWGTGAAADHRALSRMNRLSAAGWGMGLLVALILALLQRS